MSCSKETICDAALTADAKVVADSEWQLVLQRPNQQDAKRLTLTLNEKPMQANAATPPSDGAREKD